MWHCAFSAPMAYMGRNGKQYVAAAADSGAGVTDPNPANKEALPVYALPSRK